MEIKSFGTISDNKDSTELFLVSVNTKDEGLKCCVNDIEFHAKNAVTTVIRNNSKSIAKVRIKDFACNISPSASHTFSCPLPLDMLVEL